MENSNQSKRLMNLSEMKRHSWNVGWSGGKDSTATIILMHQYGIPIERIYYVRLMYDDVIPATLPMIDDFIMKAKAQFEQWGYPVEIIEGEYTYKYLKEKRFVKSKYPERNGLKYGITPLCRGSCGMNKAKVIPMERRHEQTKNEYTMIGFACDEYSRLHRLGGNKQSIMVTLGIKEEYAKQICMNYNLLSPIYKLGFKRDGCWFCPNTSKSQIKFVKRYYPNLVKIIDSIIEDPECAKVGTKFPNAWVQDYIKRKGTGPFITDVDFGRKNK